MLITEDKVHATIAAAIQSAIDHIGLGHMDDETLRHAIARGLDGPKGITKGGGAVTLKLRTALNLVRPDGQQKPINPEEDSNASA